MKLTRVLFAVLAVAALGTLVGCDLLNGRDTSSIIGSIVADGFSIYGGTSYHVVLYSQDTAMDPLTNYATAPRAMEIQGDFPGAGDVLLETVNYEMDEVPAGLYSLFVWVDLNGDDQFSRWDDAWGFNTGYPYAQLTQPYANVVVPEVGLVDADVWIDYIPAT